MKLIGRRKGLATAVVFGVGIFFLSLNPVALGQTSGVVAKGATGLSAEALVQTAAPVVVGDVSVVADPATREVFLHYTLRNQSTRTVKNVQLMVSEFNKAGQSVAGGEQPAGRINLAPGKTVTMQTRLSKLLYAPPNGPSRRYVLGLVGVTAPNGRWKEEATEVDMQQAMRIRQPMAGGGYWSGAGS